MSALRRLSETTLLQVLFVTLFIALIVFGIFMMMDTSSGTPPVVNKTVVERGFFNATSVIYPGGTIEYYKTTGTSGIKLIVTPVGKEGLKVVAIPGKLPSGSGEAVNGTATLLVRTNKAIYSVKVIATIYYPSSGFRPVKKDIILTGTRNYVLLRFVAPDWVNASVRVASVNGTGVEGFKMKNGTLTVYLDTRKLYYVGYEELDIYGNVTFEKDGVRATISRSWSVGFVYTNLAKAGVKTLHPVEAIKPFLHYRNGTLNVYALRLLNKANASLRIIVKGAKTLSYPIYYGKFPECWKAFAYLSLERVYGMVSGCNCHRVYNGLLNVSTLAPERASVVYIVTDRPVKKLTIEVDTLDGIKLEDITVTGFENVHNFPTFPASEVWDTVSKHMPVILATGTDGAPMTPAYMGIVPEFIKSPIAESMRYNLVLFAIVPNKLSPKNVTFKILVPQFVRAVTVKGSPIGSVGADYTVYSAKASIVGDVYGLIPADIVLFLDGAPYLVEHTYLTLANLRSNPVLIPSVYMGGKDIPIDYNALEVVKFWGYGVALLKSNETVLTKGGYIMRRDASITLRLENLTLVKGNGTATPEPEPFKLFNITRALKIMFFGRPGELDAVGIYVKTGNISKNGYVPVRPLAYTIQPKYAFFDEVKENPAEFVGVYNTIVNGTPVTVVSNPTPFYVKAGDRTVKPFSVAVVNATRLRVGNTTLTISPSRPLKLVPSNLTAVRVLKEAHVESPPYTVVEIPFTPGVGVPNVKTVTVSYGGARKVASVVSPSIAILKLKQILDGAGDSPVAYWTVFNGGLVLNVIIPGKPPAFSVSFGSFSVSYSGKTAKVIETVSPYDIAPFPNFYAYYLTSFKPVFFQPIPNPYQSG